MTDLPIIFSAPMVKALLAGQKTQTRRILNPVKDVILKDFKQQEEHQTGVGTWYRLPIEKMQKSRYAIGDRLYVRESLCAKNMDFGGILGLTEPLTAVDMTRGDVVASYSSDGEFVVNEDGFNLAWLWDRTKIPSIHIPRTFSRLTLVVTDVRVQRLHDISEEDAIAEGVDWSEECCKSPSREGFPPGCCCGQPDAISPKDNFQNLWRSIHGPGAWDENPWVTAISFEVHHCNIDAVESLPVRAMGEIA
jgi:hypothetical protein